MTIYTWARRRRFPRLPAPEARYFDVAPDARVLAHFHWQPARREAPTLLALHGLEGSSTAHYMVGLADKAFARGLQRRAAEPAQLRRHRGALGAASITPGLTARSARGDARAGRDRTA